jgi:hypothetical protein
MLFHTNHGFAASVAQATRRGRMRTSPARPPTKFTPNCVLDLRNVRLESGLRDRADIVRRAVDALLHVTALEAELRGNDDPVAKRLKCLA